MASRVPAQTQPLQNLALPPLTLSNENQSSQHCSISSMSPSQKPHLSSGSQPGEFPRLSASAHSASVPPVIVNKSEGCSLTAIAGVKEGANGGGAQKDKRKLKVVIPLSRREVEEDIYGLTGAKPNRRPQKRPKNIQKQLDHVFPGLWLASVTPDTYKVLLWLFGSFIFIQQEGTQQCLVTKII